MAETNSVTVNGIEYGINSWRKLVIYSVDSIRLDHEFICLDKDVARIKVETTCGVLFGSMWEYPSKLYVGFPTEKSLRLVIEATVDTASGDAYGRHTLLDFDDDNIITIIRSGDSISIKREKRK